MIKSLKDCYFATLTHHGTIALEASIINVPSYAAAPSELIGYKNACYIYKDVKTLKSKLIERKSCHKDFAEKAKRILNMRYQYTQDYEFAYKEFKDDLFGKC